MRRRTKATMRTKTTMRTTGTRGTWRMRNREYRREKGERPSKR